MNASKPFIDLAVPQFAAQLKSIQIFADFAKEKVI